MPRPMMLPLILLAAAASAPVATCSTPVGARDTAATLRQRYPGARVEKIAGAEGEETPALVLWPGDPLRRAEVLFDDEAMTRVSAVSFGARSRWQVAGIGAGTGLAAAQAANGRAFRVNGFGWDYGGYADLRGGRLAALPGGCSMSLRFTVSGAVPQRYLGDGVTIRSDDPGVRRFKPVIEDMTIAFPTR